MFKIHDDKVYFVAETPDINKVIEIFLPKDDRGTIMDSHEIRVDLCRAVIHMEKKGVRVLKVRNIEDTNKASIDIWHMPEYQEAAESPVSDVVNACIESCFDSGAMFNLPCKANRKTGRAHSKKRFGKSIGRCAPALFITILGQKASRCGGSVIKVSTFETKASQFDHTDDSYTKKKLSQRFAKLSDGTVVQRDLYSAFLLLHLRKNLQSYNKKTIKKDFPQFKMLHDKTKERLQNSHEWLPCSVGF